MNMRIQRSLLTALLAVNLAACATGVSDVAAPDQASPPSYRWIPNAPYEEVDKQGIWQLLNNAEGYEATERLLDKYFRAYQQDELLEETLIQAYKAFQSCNRTGLSTLQRWVESRPESAAAYIARASCEFGLAEKARGSERAQNTSRQQFTDLFKWLDFALADARKAILMAPDNVAAYRILLVSAKHYGASKHLMTAKEVLATFPRSYYLWVNILEGRQPKWGGSVEELQQLAEAAQEHVKESPRLHVLLGYPAHVRGKAAYHAGDYENAFKWATEALRFGDDYYYLSERAWASRKLGHYDEASKDITNAKTLFPDQDKGTAEEWAEEMRKDQLQAPSRSTDSAPDSSKS